MQFFKSRMEHEVLVDLLGRLSGPVLDPAAYKELSDYCYSRAVTKRDSRGCVPLHIAAYKTPHPEIIDLFLETGENIDRPDDEGFSSLHVACEQGNVPIVKHLLMRGIDANKRTKNGYDAAMCALTPLLQPSVNHSPRRLHQIDCCLLVLDFLTDLDRFSEGNIFTKEHTLIELAVDVSALSVVSKLIDLGAKVPDHDAKYRERHDAIMHRAVAGATFGRFKQEGFEILRLLLKHGGNPNERLTHPRRYLLDYRYEFDDVTLLLKSHGARSMRDAPMEIFSQKLK